MNYRKTIPSVLLFASVAVPFGLAQAPGSTSPSTTSPSGTTRSTGSSATDTTRHASDEHGSKTHLKTAGAENVEVRRISEAAMNNEFTAKDLIGRAVHDSSGSKLGDITDLGLAGVVDQELAKKLNHDATAAMQGQGAGQSGWKDAMSSAKRSLTGGSAVAYISVGGLFGVGDNIVAVPVESLAFDRGNDRFTLNVSKDQFVAIAEQRTSAADEDSQPRATTAPRSQVAGPDAPAARSMPTESATSEIVRIQSAFRGDSLLRDSASRIEIKASGDDLLLTGTVASEAEKERALRVAKQNSSRTIKDQLRVSSGNN